MIALFQLSMGFLLAGIIVTRAMDYLRENGRAIARLNELGALKEIMGQYHLLGGKIPDEELTAHLSRALGIVSVPDGVKAFDLEGFKKTVARFEKAVAANAKTLPPEEAARVARFEQVRLIDEGRSGEKFGRLAAAELANLLEIASRPTVVHMMAPSTSEGPVRVDPAAASGSDDVASRPTVPAPTVARTFP